MQSCSPCASDEQLLEHCTNTLLAQEPETAPCSAPPTEGDAVVTALGAEVVGTERSLPELCSVLLAREPNEPKTAAARISTTPVPVAVAHCDAETESVLESLQKLFPDRDEASLRSVLAAEAMLTATTETDLLQACVDAILSQETPTTTGASAAVSATPTATSAPEAAATATAVATPIAASPAVPDITEPGEMLLRKIFAGVNIEDIHAAFVACNNSVEQAVDILITAHTAATAKKTPVAEASEGDVFAISSPTSDFWTGGSAVDQEDLDSIISRIQQEEFDEQGLYSAEEERKTRQFLLDEDFALQSVRHAEEEEKTLQFLRDMKLAENLEKRERVKNQMEDDAKYAKMLAKRWEEADASRESECINFSDKRFVMLQAVYDVKGLRLVATLVG
eukprot:TRINITY_DN1974_c0_g1_i4.p1 TRINITY_DN1974_c0_g1~~TRINITY_DN1974_c0_g1_i4.p1  ORF type:complete len:394 (+),score=87.92 TRINITY_DN1974_c0_g1_i4:286-1467(+)